VSRRAGSKGCSASEHEARVSTIGFAATDVDTLAPARRKVPDPLRTARLTVRDEPGDPRGVHEGQLLECLVGPAGVALAEREPAAPGRLLVEQGDLVPPPPTDGLGQREIRTTRGACADHYHRRGPARQPRQDGVGRDPQGHADEPGRITITGLDASERTLAIASIRAEELDRTVTLRHGTAHALPVVRLSLSGRSRVRRGYSGIRLSPREKSPLVGCGVPCLWSI
jgi:hypothetical protein